MSNLADKIAADIANDARNTLNRITRHMASRAADDWMQKATSVMDDYYGDYSQTTMRYNRTYSLFSDAIVPVFWKKNHMYTVGIKFSPGQMDHGAMPAFNEDAIFENFMSGAHGNTKYNGVENARKIFTTSPSAKSVLDAYYDNYDKKLDGFFNEAVRLYG